MDKNQKKLSTVAIASAVLATTVAPYAASAEGETGVSTAAEVAAAVTALNPADIELYATNVSAIRTAYEALDVIEKTKVTSSTLTTLANHEAAVTVVTTIATLPTLDAISAMDAVALEELTIEVSEIRTAYVALNKTARGYIKNYSTLTSVEAAIPKQEAYLTNLPLLEPWQNAVGSLPIKSVDFTNTTVEEFKGLTEEQKLTASDLDAIIAARAEYNKLTSTLKQYVTTEELTKLTNLEAQVKLQTALVTAVKTAAVNEFTALVTALNSASVDYVENVAAVNKAYEELTEEVQLAVTTATKTLLANHTKATALIEAISQLPTVSAIENMDGEQLESAKTAAATARTQYVALISAARAYVKNYSTLTAVEAAVTKRETAIQYEEQLTAWNTAVGEVMDLPVKDFSKETSETIGFADVYEEDQLTDITAARTEYNKLTSTLKGYAGATKVAQLTALEAAVKVQVALQKTAAENKAAADALAAEVTSWEAAINALGEVADFSAIGSIDYENYEANFEAAKYTPEKLAAIKEARNVYTGLSLAAQDQVTLEQFQALIDHEAAVAEQASIQQAIDAKKQEANQKVAAEFTTAVEALTSMPQTTADEVTEYQTTVTALDFEALPEGIKALIPALTKATLVNHKAAAPVAVKIAALADVTTVAAITTEEQAKLTAIKDALTTAKANLAALSLAQKSYVKNASNITVLETAVNAKQLEIDNAEALKPFQEAMEVLPEVVQTFTDLTFKNTETEISKYDEAAVEAARQAYESLSATLKETVTDLEVTLKLHEAALEEQKALLAKAKAYSLVEDKIGQLEDAIDGLGTDAKTIPSLEDYDPDTSTLYTTEEEASINEANTAYTALGTNQEFVDAAKKDKLVAHVAALEAQKILLTTYNEGIVQALVKKITAWDITNLGTGSLADFVTGVTDTNTEVEALSAENKAAVPAATTTKLANYVAAVEVVNLISQLSTDYATKTVSNEVDEFITAAQAARTAFQNLSSAQKPLVVNIGDLANYETAVAAKKTALLTAEALTDWNQAYTAISALNTTLTFDEETFDYNTITGYYDATGLAAITEARTVYDAIDAAYQASVDSGQLEHLEKLEAIVAKYNELKAAQEAKEAAIEAALKSFKDALAAIIAAVATPHDYTGKTVADYKGAEEYSADEADLINAAETAYNEIAAAYKEDVDPADEVSLQAYIDSLTAYQKFVTEENNAAAIEAAMADWTTKLGLAIAITPKGYVNIDATNVGTTGFEEHAPGDKQTILDAREAFNALATEGELGNLQERAALNTDYSKLTALEAEITAYTNALNAKNAAEKEEKIQALVDAVTALDIAAADYTAKVDAAFLLFKGLTAEAQTEFNTTKAETAAALTNHRAIASVVTKVKSATTVEAINATTSTNALNGLNTGITTARSAYDNLTAAQKAIYTDAAIVALETAFAAQQTKLNNATALQLWTDAYALMPMVVEVTAVTSTTYTDSEKQQAQDVRDAYTNLEAATKALVPADELANLEKLEAAIAKQEELEAADVAAAALLNFKAALAQLTFAEVNFSTATVANFGSHAKYSTDQLAAIQAAVSEFGELTADVKGYLTAEEQATYDKFAAGMKKQQELQTAYDASLAAAAEADKLSAFVNGLTALNPSASTYVADFANVKTAYEALTPELLAKVTSSQKTIYGNHEKATTLVAAIVEVSKPERLEAATDVAALNTLSAEVEAAQAMYAALSTAVRSYVKNYSSISATRSAIAAKKVALEKAEAIKTWTDAYATLPEVLDFSNVSYKTINNAATYSTSEIAAAQALRGIYNGFTSTVKGYVNAEEYQQLVAVEAAIKRQEELIAQSANAADIDAQLQAWTTAIKAVPTAIDVSALTAENYASTTLYQDGTEAAVQAARAAYTAIASAYKGYVTPSDLEKLAAVEASLVVIAKVKSQVNAATAETEAAPVIEAITLLTSPVGATIVKGQYDALTPEAQAKVATSLKTKLTNYAGAEAIQTLMAALPDEAGIKGLTTEDALTAVNTQIADIRTAYSKLTTAARNLITNYASVTTTQTLVTTQLNKVKNAAFLVSWNDAVEALPIVIEVSDVTVGSYSGEDQLKITEARAEYNKLSSTLRTSVDADALAKLVKLEQGVKQQLTLEAAADTTAANDFTKLVNALKSTSTTYVDDVATVTKAYDTLEAEVLAKVSSSTKTLYNNHKKASDLVTKISEIESKLPDVTAYKAAITAARADYVALSKAARAYVNNYSTLTAHEATAKKL